jgi:hypothetical protein
VILKYSTHGEDAALRQVLNPEYVTGLGHRMAFICWRLTGKVIHRRTDLWSSNNARRKAAPGGRTAFRQWHNKRAQALPENQMQFKKRKEIL